jgi:hypothetical protein
MVEGSKHQLARAAHGGCAWRGSASDGDVTLVCLDPAPEREVSEPTVYDQHAGFSASRAWRAAAPNGTVSRSNGASVRLSCDSRLEVKREDGGK